MKRFLLTLLMLLPAAARAEIAIGENIDWLAITRLEIGEYKLIEAVDRAKPGAHWITRHFLLKRKGRFKGEPPKRVRFSRHVPVKSQHPNNGHRYLVFFNHQGRVDYVIDLENPGETASWERAFAANFTEIRGRRKILRALKSRLAYHDVHGWPKIDTKSYVNGKPGSGYIKLEAPFNSAAHDRLFGGSAVYLIVPADPALEKTFLDQTQDVEISVRAQAAWRLANYHTAHSERLLRSLLNDPGASVLTTQARSASDRIVYPVRQAAYRALQGMGVRVDRPQGYDKNYPDSFLE
ncbi:MAG: hypothetical protein COB53_11940 [Elusimicrobia bacterium]|nr:MAG: hypothetical protein COB53_11940 [Elusimicrobiota bacterium]